MAGVSFHLDDSLAQDILSRIERAASRPTGAMHAIGAHFVMSAQRNIETETAPDGSKWPPLSPRTANQRVGRRGARRGYDHMLRVTNRLYASISYVATDRSMEWGSNVEYARVHQLGGVIQMPARQGKVTLKSIRRKGGGIRSRFARAGTKGSETRDVEIRAHQVRIPARPYLGISPFDRDEVPEVVAVYLRSEVGR